jgi:hypothetical protein
MITFIERIGKLIFPHARIIENLKNYYKIFNIFLYLVKDSTFLFCSKTIGYVAAAVDRHSDLHPGERLIFTKAKFSIGFEPSIYLD